jgi:hypothetical protein
MSKGAYRFGFPFTTEVESVARQISYIASSYWKVPQDITELIAIYAVPDRIRKFGHDDNMITPHHLFAYSHPQIGHLLFVSTSCKIHLYLRNEGAFKPIHVLDGMRCPCGMAIWRERFLLIAEMNSHQILIVDIRSADPNDWTFQVPFTWDNQFKSICDLTVNYNRCLVVDRNNHKVQFFALSVQNGLCVFSFQTSIAFSAAYPWSIVSTTAKGSSNVYMSSEDGNIHSIHAVRGVSARFLTHEKKSASSLAMHGDVLYSCVSKSVEAYDMDGKLLKRLDISILTGNRFILGIAADDRFLYVSHCVQKGRIIVIPLNLFVSK